MKDYLSKHERNQLIFIKKYIDTIEKMLETWKNNLTKEEHKALKTASTWGLKAFESITTRQNDTAFKTLWNCIKSSFVNIEDKFAIEIFNKKISSKLNDCYENNKDYYKLVEITFSTACRNCTKKCAECDYYKEFEEHCIPEPDGFEKLNCKYSWIDKEKVV